MFVLSWKVEKQQKCEHELLLVQQAGKTDLKCTLSVPQSGVQDVLNRYKGTNTKCSATVFNIQASVAVGPSACWRCNF